MTRPNARGAMFPPQTFNLQLYYSGCPIRDQINPDDKTNSPLKKHFIFSYCKQL